MPCQHIKSKDGKTTAILNIGNDGRRTKCASCGDPSDYECDFPTGNKSGTCDAKICARCTLHIGGRWMDFGTEFQKLDSYDFCKVHQPFVFVHESRLIYVVNCRDVGNNLFSDDAQASELIDRTTPLGNPFKLDGEDTPAKRAAVISRFKRHLWEQMKDGDSAVSRDLARLREIWLTKKVLMLRCWCAPKACHGQVIAKALVWQAQEGER